MSEPETTSRSALPGQSTWAKSRHLGQSDRFNHCLQAKSLIELFMSICVLGMWPKNRLYANIPPSWQMDGLAAIRPSALRSMLDVRIGYDALIQAIGLGLTFIALSKESTDA
jgi:hypothetical protein